MKKLQGAPLHRAKLGYADRLLLQFVRRGDETVCVALEIVEGHAYERARFLRGARVDESKLEELPASGPEATAVPYVHPSRDVVHFLDKVISFDDAQDAILHLPCPNILVGSAGAGRRRSPSRRRGDSRATSRTSRGPREAGLGEPCAVALEERVEHWCASANRANPRCRSKHTRKSANVTARPAGTRIDSSSSR